MTAALLWEITRRVLVWYFTTLSQVSVVYGSLTTAIAVVGQLTSQPVTVGSIGSPEGSSLAIAPDPRTL